MNFERKKYFFIKNSLGIIVIEFNLYFNVLVINNFYGNMVDIISLIAVIVIYKWKIRLIISKYKRIPYAIFCIFGFCIS